MSEVVIKANLAKEAAADMILKTTQEKNEALRNIAGRLRDEIQFLLTENTKDIEAGKEKGLTPDVLDRLTLDEKRILAIADAVELLVGLEDPTGEKLETNRKRQRPVD